MAERGEAERLTTWAEIGAYIGRTPRTAKRYEQERGLPVRRMPGDAKSTVYAFKRELDAWLRTAPVEDAPEPVDASSPPIQHAAPGQRRRRPLGWPLAVGLVIALGAIAAIVGLGGLRTANLKEAGGREAATQAQALYGQGLYAFERRTPEGIRNAIDLFTQAIVAQPDFEPAYVGLANCYNLAPEFAGMRPDDAYPRAKAAAERALILAPQAADAHRALAFVEFWWARDVSVAFREFATAARLDPKSAQTHHWFANALAERGDPRALAEIEAALALDPSTPTMADKGWIQVMLGRYAEGEATLRNVARLQPDYATAHTDLALLARRRGQISDELAENRRAAELEHDADELKVAAVGQEGLAKGGEAEARRRVVAERERLAALGRGSPFELAADAAMLRRRDATLLYLRRSRDARAPGMAGVDTNPDFAWLRADAAFKALTPRPT